MFKNKKLLAAVLAIVLVLCLLPAAAFAAGNGDEASEAEESTETAAPVEEAEETEDADEAPEAEEEEEEDAEEPEEDAEEDEYVFVLEGETYYNNGGIVFNNGGTVYNNGGEVFNNGGVVYNNLGVVYNNGGTVYNNKGTVYVNDGETYNNNGEVIEAVCEREPVIELAEDIDTYAVVSGLIENEEGELVVDEDGVITIEAKAGFELLSVTAGDNEVIEEDGVFTVTEISSDCVIEAEAKLLAPELSLESATYAEKQKLSITAAEGAEIYFTIDGSEPDENSTHYRAAMSISDSTVIKAIAVMDGVMSSDVSVGEYAFVSITAPKFESVDAGYEQPEAKAIVVENKGDVNAVIVGVELSGEDAESFTLSTTDGAAVAANSKDDSTWTIQPNAELETEVYKVNVIFTLDSGDTVSVSISFRVK